MLMGLEALESSPGIFPVLSSLCTNKETEALQLGQRSCCPSTVSQFKKKFFLSYILQTDKKNDIVTWWK